MGEKWVSKTRFPMASVPRKTSPARDRRIAWTTPGEPRYISKMERPTASPGAMPRERRPWPSEKVKTPCSSTANTTMGAPAMTVRSRSSTRRN